MHFNHITLQTGHSRRSERQEVADATIVASLEWLTAAVDSGNVHPLFAPVQDYAGSAMVIEGALVVTVYGRAPHVGTRPPLVTIGVAQRSRHAQPLWDSLTKAARKMVRGLARPPVPWCAASIHASSSRDVDALGWIAQFETALAWAWITRHPDIRGV